MAAKEIAIGKRLKISQAQEYMIFADLMMKTRPWSRIFFYASSRLVRTE